MEKKKELKISRALFFQRPNPYAQPGSEYGEKCGFFFLRLILPERAEKSISRTLSIHPNPNAFVRGFSRVFNYIRLEVG